MNQKGDRSLSLLSFSLTFGAGMVFAYATWFDIPKDAHDLRQTSALICVLSFAASAWFAAKAVLHAPEG
jgi:hypothetical protein